MKQDGATFSTQLLSGVFAARAVVHLRTRPLAKSPHYSDQAGANSHSL